MYVFPITTHLRKRPKRSCNLLFYIQIESYYLQVIRRLLEQGVISESQHKELLKGENLVSTTKNKINKLMRIETNY